jgi:hypothetical protein
MTITNVYISQESQEVLIEAAALKKISVEELASEILGEGIRSRLLKNDIHEHLIQNSNVNIPLAGLQPYAFHAKPEESALSSDEWTMESEEG